MNRFTVTGVVAGAALAAGPASAHADEPGLLAQATQTAPEMSPMPPRSKRAKTAKAKAKRAAARPKASSGTGPTAAFTYFVKPGDSLWSIAGRFTKPPKTNQRILDLLHRIWFRNEIRIGTGDPNLIFPRQLLRIPR
jgi:nucleoid-associated protein YgaU